MIAAKALRLAGDGSHLVRRPAGVLHVYTGPLTPSGRFVPRRSRTVCRTRTRRLEVVAAPTTFLAAGPRLCGRCSTRLNSLPRASRVERHPASRADFLGAHAETSKADLAFALQLAKTPDEVDAAAHLTLVLFDVAGTLVPFTDHGRTFAPLHQHLIAARTRVRGYPESRYVALERGDAQSAAGRELAIARRREAKADREARILRVGIRNVPARRRPTRGVRP